MEEGARAPQGRDMSFSSGFFLRLFPLYFSFVIFLCLVLLSFSLVFFLCLLRGALLLFPGMSGEQEKGLPYFDGLRLRRFRGGLPVGTGIGLCNPTATLAVAELLP